MRLVTKCFHLYSDRFETYYVFNAKSKSSILFTDIKRIEFIPAKYNDWGINRIALHLNNGKNIKLDCGSKYIEVLKAINSAGFTIAITDKKKRNIYADKAEKSGVIFG